MEYDLEIDNLLVQIKKNKAGKILIQLPDGLKPKAKKVVDEIRRNCKDCEVDIWAESCYGSCDVPDVKDCGYDFLIQWGHAEWK